MPVPATAVKREGDLFLCDTWRKGFLGGHKMKSKVIPSILVVKDLEIMDTGR